MIAVHACADTAHAERESSGLSRRELRAISGKSRSRRIHGRRRLSVDMALRLARLFGTSERFWLNLQNEIDVRNRRDKLSPELEAIQPVAQDG